MKIVMKQVWAACTAFGVLMVSATLHAQTLNKPKDNQPKPPDSAITPPANPLGTLGQVPMMSGAGIAPLGTNYMGGVPNPTAGDFQQPQGFPPRGQAPEHHPQAKPKYATPLPNSGVVVTLPPAATGRQGLPPQTWALLTPRQQDLHRQAETAAMSSPLGEGFTWTDDGRYGEVRVMADRVFNSRPCRDFTHLVTIDGQRVTGNTTVCR